MDRIPGKPPMENPPPLAGLDPAELLKQGAADDTLIEGAPASFNPPPMEELAAVFLQFEILELIGQGGMGAVYKVRQKDLDRIVALKILPPGIGQSPEFSRRFTREARALAKLNHPGIVTLHEFGQQDGLYFILMEFVDGLNLAQLMKTGRISPREALVIVPQICDALQYAHDQGIVHRDIKPENILLDRLGRVKVADFGIAKVVAAVCEDPIRSGDTPVPVDATLAGKIIGTPQYMAPEQIEHPSDVDHRADIYALGVVFYQMLTGELPGRDLQAPSRKLQIDVRLDEIVLKALEKNPDQRYQHASVMKTRVETISAVDKSSDKVRENVLENDSVPLSDKAIRWCIHLVWAACTSGLVALAITFVSEILTKDRGNLNQSRMTLEDYYGPVITVLLGCGLLAVPIKDFRFASARVWIGAVFATAGITAITYVLAAPVEDRAFHAENFIVAVALCAFGAFLCGFAAVFGKEKLRVSQDAEHQLPPVAKRTSQQNEPSPSGWRKTKWIATACLAIGALCFALRPPGRFYPVSSASSAFKAPVMGRIEFKCSHAESISGTNVSYDVKMWGDTQWNPSSGMSLALKSGRLLIFKSRVNAMNPDAPVAMVATSSDDTNWETKELKIDGKTPGRNLVFSNGLRVEIHWTPAATPIRNSEPPDPVQMQVMRRESRRSDEMHPVSSGSTTSLENSALPTYKKLEAYDWKNLAAEGRVGDRVPQTLDGRTVLKIENLKDETLQAHLLTIEKPPISATKYALSGEIRYENVKGPAYLEMWSVYPKGRYFSRTLGEPGSGPMSQLAGTSAWREFTLPFDRTGTADAPTRIEVNLFLPGRGVVYVGPLKLIEVGPDTTAHDGSGSSTKNRNEDSKSPGSTVAESAEAWLAKIDAGDYNQSWKDASEFFRNAITESVWSELMTRSRKPLGALKSRKLHDSKIAPSLPGAPDGEYVVMQFETSFSTKEKAVETVTFMKQTDGTLKAAGYFIR